MGGHVSFLSQQLANGTLVVAGPVLSPAGVFGVAVIEADSIEGVRKLLADDPVNAIGSYEVFPMGDAVARPRA